MDVRPGNVCKHNGAEICFMCMKTVVIGVDVQITHSL